MNRRSLCAAGLVLLLSGTALATTYPGLDWTRLVALSDVVVHVEIERQDVRELASGRLATFYRARLLETLAGDPGRSLRGEPANEVLFALPGGVLGDRGQRVSGMPRFEVGQQLIVFLGSPGGPDGARGIVGHALGSFTVDGRGRLFADPELGGHPEVPRRLSTLREKLRRRTDTSPIEAPR